MNPVRFAIRCLARIAGGRASAVRAVSGAPAALVKEPGRSGRDRRGTILVIVLGTLALMAVITVVYVVVGRADRRAVAAFVGSTRREEVPELVRDYIAGIIGRDALATYRDASGTLKREAFDYPFSDPLLRSVLPGQAGVPGVTATPLNQQPLRRFNAEGTFDVPYVMANQFSPDPLLTGSIGSRIEPRVPADPWLAATQPTNILTSDDLTDGTFPQYEMRDWAHISNIAPDGRYVNLFNLRNNFDAATGFNPTLNQISSRLTLTNSDGSSQPAGGNQRLATGGNASPNTPAHWSSSQLGAFRPTNAPMLRPQPAGSGASSIMATNQSPWRYPEYAPYQWADTDGDGFYDARWQELVDASDGVDVARALFPREDGFRWFVAARVQDLSALVNVNTATDFLLRPTQPTASANNYPGVGASPADIDLRRLLTGEDLWEMSGFVGYLGLRPPAINPNVTNINIVSAQYYGPTGTAVFGPGTTGNTGMQQWDFVGDSAYNLARTYLQFGIVPRGNVRLEPPAYANYVGYLNQQLAYTQVFGYPPSALDLMRFTNAGGSGVKTPLEDRRDWFRAVSGVVAGATGQELTTSVFGLESEAELRAFRSANDPMYVSPLELVMDGRYGDDTLFPASIHSSRYGVLRSNRLANVETLDLDRSNERGGSSLVPPGTLAARNPDGMADLDAMTRSLVDVRQYLTTISGSRPLFSRPIFGVWDSTDEYREVRFGEDPRDLDLWTSAPLGAGLLGADSQSVLNSSAAHASQRIPSVEQLFRIYCDALLPYSFLEEAWDRTSAGDSYRTLSYGYQGAELALRHAAHMAVNMAVMVQDSPNGPSATQAYAYTVIANERVESNLSNDSGPMGSRRYPWSWWTDTSRRLDLNKPLQGTQRRTRLADTNTAGEEPVNAAFTVFPIQPQPFLTEVTGFVVYVDAPQSAGGDNEGTDITINGAHSATNNDLAWQGLAFQITNPFPHSITLNADEYYFECYAGNPSESRYFRIPATGSSITLGRHDTVVLYVQLRSDADTVTKWDQYASGSGAQLPQFKSTLMTVNGRAPVQLEEFDPGRQNDPPDPTGGIFEDLGGRYATEFRLWHAQRVASAGESDFQSNSIANDYLVDRLRDPGAGPAGGGPLGPTLQALRLNNGTNAQINGAAAVQVLGEPNYNEGVTFMLWSTMRRPSDDQAAALANKNDVVWLPAYCLERKFAAYNGAVLPLNVGENEGLPRSGLDRNDIDNNLSSPLVALEFDDVVNDVTSGGPPVSTLAERPVDKTDDPIALNAQGQSWQDVRAELYTALGGAGARKLRPADMLIPPAIGPVFEAVRTGSGLTPANNPWTTLSEAMALALDYDNDTDTTTLHTRPARPQASPTLLDRGSIVRGHLVLDTFVPFFDTTPNGQAFNPANDLVLDEGQPLALRIVDQFRGLDDQYGNVRRPIQGQININTAPLAVLRTLPMLSPTHGADPSSGGWVAGSAWWGDATGQTKSSDVASAVLAYRDRVTAYPRGDVSGNAPTAPNDVIDFSVEGTGQLNARGFVSGVQGVRELPGFRSVAELMNVREYATRIGSDPGYPGLHDFDRLGFDGVAINADGLDPVYRQGSGAARGDTMVDEFDERLALLAAIGNSVTVRSDVYCVWFVLHGYRREDCQGLSNSLSDAEPLLPSVGRRFMMIVDRSTVVSPGDRPKILLFRELPYAPTAAGDGSAI